MAAARLDKHGTLVPSLVLFIGAGMWGLFWLPLRAIDNAGVNGPWAVVALNVACMILLLPLAVMRRRDLVTHWRAITLIGMFIGASLVCYSLSLIYTTIIRATLLYYLTPIWSTLIAMVILGETVTWRRWVAIGVGFAGLFIMLYSGDGVSTNINFGDVIGLLAGIFWGFGATYMRRHTEVAAIDTVLSQYLFAAIIGLALVWPLLEPSARYVPLQSWIDAAPVTLAFAAFVFVPSVIIIFWAVKRMSPGRAGILMMSEVLVAGISATLYAGEFLTLREAAGAALIVGAGAIEILTPTPKAA